MFEKIRKFQGGSILLQMTIYLAASLDEQSVLSKILPVDIATIKVCIVSITFNDFSSRDKNFLLQ